LSNKLIPYDSFVFDCPFSDHCFTAASYNLGYEEIEEEFIWRRNLSIARMKKIRLKLLDLSFGHLEYLNSPEEFWMSLKSDFLNVLDSISSLEKVLMKEEKNSYVWFDHELKTLSREKVKLKQAKISKKDVDWIAYKCARNEFKKLFRIKLKNFFAKHESKDFKNSKKFWNFYSNLINIKSCNKKNKLPALIRDGISKADTKDSIVNLFNSFFTNISSTSSACKHECSSFINSRFDEMVENKFIELSRFSFDFSTISQSDLIAIIEGFNLKTSPGIDNIPWKFYLENIDILAPHIIKLFNLVLKTNVMPKDWKCALVTPLYKSKGSKQDCNNYRGISVLSPIAKLFEIVLSRQLNLYLSKNKFIVENQHGFREGFSCESALHELFNDLNLARDKKKACSPSLS